MLDIILELVLDGAIGVVGSKKIPIAIRIPVALILLLFIYGTCGLLIYVGKATNSIALSIIGILLIAIFTVLIISKVKQYKNKQERIL